MSYNRQNFVAGEIFTEVQADQLEENIAAHIHGQNSVSAITLAAFAAEDIPRTFASGVDFLVASVEIPAGVLVAAASFRFTAIIRANSLDNPGVWTGLGLTSLVFGVTTVAHISSHGFTGAAVPKRYSIESELFSVNSSGAEQEGMIRVEDDRGAIRTIGFDVASEDALSSALPFSVIARVVRTAGISEEFEVRAWRLESTVLA